MFLSFGRKTPSTKKPGTPLGSPITVSSTRANPAVDVSSRSTVQTVAGPLLSSTRFNSVLDASTLANVNSPGFTSRVVNCASNGSSPYSDHGSNQQNNYTSVGLFPKVQLSGKSILPILSPRNSQKVGRTLVRVRIASPSFTERRRHSVCSGSIQDRVYVSKHSQLVAQQHSSKESCTIPTKSIENNFSATESVQEASRKRIFSESQDACQDDVKKRRRRAEIPIPNPNNDMYHYRHVRVPAVPSAASQLVSSSQVKRAREKGSPEEQKHQRRKTCNTNNAIFSSLSSSRNLLERLAAQKRKSIDASRSSSPLTPLSGKLVKERKTATDVKAIQCNLDVASQYVKISERSSDLSDTPVSSKDIHKRSAISVKENDGSARKDSSDVSLQTPTCDYNTKLFRKEISSNTPRTSVLKSQKPSLWVRAPEADELTCSLLSDDSNLDRPERLKSLLACVSGKDKKSEENKLITSSSAETLKETLQISLPAATSPGSTGSKTLSPSSAFTVTVSSTCTIMTSATVTSVNGIPSSESGRSPLPRPISSTSIPSLNLTVLSAAKTVTSNAIKADQSAGSSVTVNISGTTSPVLSTPGSFSSTIVNHKNPASTESVKSAPSMFTLKPPLKSSESPTARSSSVNLTSTSQPALQFGAGTSAVPTSTAQFGISAPNPSTQFGSGSTSISTPSAPSGNIISESGSAAVQFGATNNSASVNSTAAVSKPAFSFGSSSTSVPKPALQFGSSTPATSGSAQASKPSFQFGSSGTPVDPKPAPQLSLSGPTPNFGLSASTTVNSSKPAFSFEANAASSNGLSGAPRVAFSFGSSGLSNKDSSRPSKPALSFGANSSSSNGPSEAAKPSFSFGPSAPSSNASSGVSKPVLPFGASSSSSSSPSEALKSANHLFGSSGPLNNGSSGASKPAFSFGTSGASESTQPSLSFGASEPSSSVCSGASKPAFSFGASGGSSFGSSKSVSFGSVESGSFGSVGSGSFGSSAAGSFEAPKPSFGSTNGGFQFGSSTNDVSGTLKSTFQFQQNNGSTSSPQNMTSTMDTAKTAFSFGPSMGKSSEMTKPAFQFSNSTDQPTFGSQASSSAFGQAAPQQAQGTFAFGSSGPAFGSGSANSSSFGSASSPAFGAPASSAPSFGSVADSKPSGFGSAPSFGSTTPSAFSFNANSAPIPSGSFPSASSKGGFAFGQKQDQAPQAFNFNASITSVSNTTAPPTPGFFSAGTGSQRRVQTARRRR